MSYSDKRAHLYLLILIGCIGVILRVYYVFYYSLWLDEMMQVVAASASWQEIFGLVALHSSPPLDYIIMKIVILLFGKSDWIVRMPALLFGSASIYAFYSFARSLTGRDTALTAAALMALSPMAIVYSQEARMYSLFLLLSLISFRLTLLVIEKNNFKTNLYLGMVNGLLLLTHYFGIFVIAGETILLLAALLLDSDKRRSAGLIMISPVVSFLMFLPWLPGLLAHVGRFGGEVRYALWADRYFFISIFSSFTIFAGRPDAWFNAHLLVFMAGIFQTWRNKEKNVLVVALALVGMLGMLLGVTFFRKIVTPRNVLFLLPLFLLVCAYGINTLLQFFRIPSLVGNLAVVLLILWPAMRLPLIYHKINWRDAAQYVEQHLRGEEKVITTDCLSRSCLAYYLDPGADYVIMGKRGLESANVPGDKIWVVNDQLLAGIKAKRFLGWAAIPPTAYDAIGEQTLDEYNVLMGRPVQQFTFQDRNLNIYYLQPVS
jgi:uncharacterized membrane protein